MNPPSKPQATRAQVEAAAREWWVQGGKDVALFPSKYVFAVRGYYEDSMGKKDQNDVGINDDAFFIVTPTHFSSWNGNTDPSRYGWNAGADKFMARLKPGCWSFIRLKHKMSSPNGYMAFGQGGKNVTVERIKQDGSVAVTESGQFGINLHRGGNTGTSSEGCQTVPPAQWSDFDKTLSAIVGKDRFDYILSDKPFT